MIIDAHTHLGKPGGALNARADELLRSMDQAGIDKALVFAGRLNGITTDEVLEETRPHRDRLKVVASISPHLVSAFTRQDSDEAWRLIDLPEVVGMKFYPGYEHYYPSIETGWFRSIIMNLNAAGKPAIFHSGDTYSKAGKAKLKYAQPLILDDLATEYPDLKIVIAHMGYPWVRDAAEVCYKNKNVYSDVSGFVYGDFQGHAEMNFRKAVAEFTEIAGPDKLLFGTDWPISSQASYVQVLRKMAEGTETLFHTKAEELFKL